MAERTLFGIRFSEKFAESGLGLLAFRGLVGVLDWWQRVDVLKAHFGGIVEFINGPYGTLALVLGGFALIALAIVRANRKSPGETPPSPTPDRPPPSGPSALFDFQNSHVEMDDTDISGRGDQPRIHGKDSKIKTKRWKDTP